MKRGKRMLSFLLIFFLAMEEIPIAAQAKEIVQIEVEVEAAPKEGIQGQTSIFTLLAKEADTGLPLSEGNVSFQVGEDEIEEKEVDSEGNVVFSYQFLQAGNHKITFLASSIGYQPCRIQFTYQVKINNTMRFTCQDEMSYGSKLILSCEAPQKGIIQYKILPGGSGAAYIIDNTLVATKAGDVKVEATLKNEADETINQAEHTFSIFPKEVTFQAAIKDKTYNSTTDAEYDTISELQGVLQGDKVELIPGTPAFQSADVGEQKIEIKGAALSGEDATNYSLSLPTDLKASIQRKRIQIGQLKVKQKLYDGTVEATFEKPPCLINLPASDLNKIELIVPKITYLSPKAGKQKVMFQPFSIKGKNAKNYELVQPEGLEGFIEKATLTVTAEDKERDYGAKNPPLTYTVEGFGEGESENSVLNYEKPKVSCDLHKKSKPGIYKNRIQIKEGNPGENYQFCYVAGTMTIHEKNEPGDETNHNTLGQPQRGKHYQVSKANGNHFWFKQNGRFEIRPILTGGYDKIAVTPSGPWKNKLYFTKDTQWKSVSFFLMSTKTGKISKIVKESYQMDQEVPSADYKIVAADGQAVKAAKHTSFGSVYGAGCRLIISAADQISGVDWIRYYMIDANTGKKTIAMQEYSHTITITLPDTFKGYVYATVQDIAGNRFSFGTKGIITSVANEANKYVARNRKQKNKDSIAPIVKITYDKNQARKNGYYQGPRRATLQIQEYDLKKVVVTVKKDQEIKKKQLSFQKQKKEYTDKNGNPYYLYQAKIDFIEDGKYSLNIVCEDSMGNKNNGVRYSKESNAMKFTIDSKQPTVSFRQVQSGKSYQDNVQTSFLLRDKNLEMETLKYSLIGKIHGKVNLDGKMVSYPGGFLYVLQEIPKEKKYDDIYTLMVSIADKSGNRVEETIQFCVNRFGSEYRLESYVKKINHSYCRKVQDLVLIERNLNQIRNRTLCLNQDGMIYPLIETKDYTVTCFGNGNTYYEYMYVLPKSLFERNGIYRIEMRSQDMAGNVNHGESLAFVVDAAAPILLTSNLVNEKTYLTKGYKVKLQVKDNIEMENIEIKLDGKRIKYTLHAKEISFILRERTEKQKLEIKMEDKAGNKVKVRYKIYVTKNPFVWLLKAKISKKIKLLFLLCFFLCSFGIATLVFLLYYGIRQRKKLNR